MTIMHIAYKGPHTQDISLAEGHTHMFLGIKGSGELTADTLTRTMVPESIAIPIASSRITFTVAKGETFHFLHFEKRLTEKDIEDMANFPEENRYELYFTKFIVFTLNKIINI